jgi:hypothetical protein
MTVQGADMQVHVQRLVSIVKMTTVLEWCITEEQHSVVHFLWAKWLDAKYLHKEIFPVYCGKCLSRKAVRKWVNKFSQGSSKVAGDETEVRNFLKQQSKDLCCRIWGTGEAMGQEYHRWWRICREIKVFPGLNITCFPFYIHLWPIYWLFLVYKANSS